MDKRSRSVWIAVAGAVLTLTALSLPPGFGRAAASPDAQTVLQRKLTAVQSRSPCILPDLRAGDDGAVEIETYVPSSFDVDGLTRELSPLANVAKIPVGFRSFSQQHCETLSLVRRLDIEPKGRLSLAAALAGKSLTFADGDSLAFAIDQPPADGFLQVEYFQSDGQVVHLVSSPVGDLPFARKGAQILLGVSDDEQATWSVGPPFGEDLILILLTRGPIFEEFRPEVEETQDFLVALDRALNQGGPAPPSALIAVDFLFITTGPKLE